MYQVSLFINTWSKTPTTITFEDFFAMVRNGHWKVPTEGHRSCLAKDRKHDAQTIKDSMACVIPAGICKNGHAKNNLTSLSLALCIDIDHTDEQTKDIFVRACLLEYVLGAFISISGRGVKLFIRIDIDGVNDYPAIYEATAKLVSPVLGVENDGKCKDITHPCFGSYDPDAYYNGDAKAVNDFLPNGALTPRVTYAPVTSAPRTTCTPTSFSNGHPPAKAGNRISAAPFVQSYLTLYPAVTGDRNGTVFRLSCAACKRGIDRTELTTELVRTLEEDNFREPEIARTVKSAYQNIMTAAETESFENPPSNSSKVQKSVIGFSENENPAEKEDEIIGEELREQTPTFPDEIYDLIPAIFKECVSIARDERERDGLLLSCITTISSMLPSVNIRYNRRNYQPNIYCIVVASSGANKNLIGYGIRLHKHYCEYWEKQSLKIEKEYKKALRDYTLSLQAIRKKNTAATNLPDEPEEPKLAFPLIPADISRAQLITHLINNQSCSSLLTSTEASSVSTARNQDYGHFDDILCKAFEHELISSSYKINGRHPLKVEYPSLSAFLTGTPSSLILFIPTMETGLYNRFLINTFRLPAAWQDVFAEEKVRADDLFNELSMRFAQMALFLKECRSRAKQPDKQKDSPTEVKLTDTQKKEFNRVFTQLLKDTDQLGNDDLLGVVKRYGVITARICCIFSAIDKGTMRMETPEVYCSDAHFKAALAIVLCCFEHSKLVSTSVKSSAEDTKPLQSPDNLSRLLTKLKKSFSAKEACALGEELNLSRSTVYYLLNKGIKAGRISKLGHGSYILKI